MLYWTKAASLAGTLASLCLLTQPATAQTLQELQFGQTSETRVMAGVTIPLGGSANTAEAAPRFDLGFAQRAQRSDVLPTANPVRAYEEQQWRTNSFSLTFEENPRMMLNDVQVARFGPTLHADETDDGEEDGDGKGGGVSPWLIGGGILLGATVWATFEAADDFTDIFRED